MLSCSHHDAPLRHQLSLMSLIRWPELALYYTIMMIACIQKALPQQCSGIAFCADSPECLGRAHDELVRALMHMTRFFA